jgi:hypothetical protein
LFLKHEVVQKPYNEMYNESIYLAIKIKNRGNKGAWGVLHCHVDNEFKEKVEIRLVGANDTALIVLPYYGLINYTINDKPFLNTYWKNLYTKLKLYPTPETLAGARPGQGVGASRITRYRGLRSKTGPIFGLKSMFLGPKRAV